MTTCQLHDISVCHVVDGHVGDYILAKSCANRIKDPVLSPVVINKLPAPEMHILVRVQFYRTLTVTYL